MNPLAQKDAIEESFDGPLDWQPLQGGKACRIYKRFDGVGYRNQERWDELQQTLITAMINLEHALRPYIGRLTT